MSKFVTLRKKKRIRSAYKQNLKLKTLGAAKKRFKVSKNGHLISTQANKQHNMRKRSSKQIRGQRGTNVIKSTFAKKVIKFYNLKRKKRKA